jgi:hypothetical protein
MAMQCPAGSSEFWDEWHTELAGGMCICCCVSSMVSRYIDYTVEACEYV